MATEPNELLKKMEQDYMQIRDERGTYKNTATRIGNAFLSILEYLKNAPFVRKDVDDTVSGLLTMLSGCVIGESGQIKMNPDGPSAVALSVSTDQQYSTNWYSITRISWKATPSLPIKQR